MPVPRYPQEASWALFSAGFRPFFLAAGVWACIAMVTWLSMLAGILNVPTHFSPVAWHFHELLFGFIAAAIAGFLLTAIPNWTGRFPLQGWRLVLLFLLWVAGRLVIAFSAWTPASTTAVIDLAFVVVLGLVAAREIIVGRNWRNLPVLAALVLLAIANGMLHVGSWGTVIWEEYGKRLAVAVVVMLIALIGGRIIPSFTANWLRKRGVDKLPSGFGIYDQITLGITALALAAWVFALHRDLAGVTLILTAIMHAVRLSRWRGIATISEPLLWILHLGYAWIPIGFVMLGVAAWRPDLGTTAVHLMTVGAMGTMIVAVMTRASLGHSQRELTAGRGTLLVYLLVLVAGIARVAAPFLPGYDIALQVAGMAWIAGFALFVVLYIPLFVRR